MPLISFGEQQEPGATASPFGVPDWLTPQPGEIPLAADTPQEAGALRSPGSSLIPNELEKFASFSNIITLSVLSQDEVNDPTIIRENGPSVNILKSGGGITKPQTAIEAAEGITTEFFIDNFEMDAIVVSTASAGNTNATQMTFTVHEPYSMGLFIETLRVSARQQGWASHIEAPYLLTLEFVGWDDKGEYFSPGSAKRMIPIRIIDAVFEVTQGGSVYTVTAIPWNELALGDDVQKTQADTTIKGRNVFEILQSGLSSLASIINSRELSKQETDQTDIADQYIIAFPKPGELDLLPSLAGLDASEGPLSGIQKDEILFRSIRGTDAEIEDQSRFDELKNEQLGKIKPRTQLGETLRDFFENEDNINDIAKKTITEEWLDLGEHPFGSEALAYDEESETYKRTGIELTLSDDVRSFKFRKGTSIQDIIEEVILASTYAKSLVEQLKDPPPDGMLDWFKIETQCFVVRSTSSIRKTGRSPKVYVYRVVPYKAHINIFKSPTSPAPGVEEIKGEVVKQYQYIYTGNNNDVLNFEIKYDYAYNTGLLSDLGQSRERVKAQEGVIHTPPGDAAALQEGPEDVPAEGPVPIEESAAMDTVRDGGARDETVETAIAKQWNQILLKSEFNLVTVDITIKGDPYFVSDSGLGNYNAKDTSFTNVNSDGAMNYQNGEVYVNIVFRTPVDYSPTDGTVLGLEDTEIVKAFSGVYRVIEVKTSIESNKFTQTLRCNRMLGQEDGAVTSMIKTAAQENSILGSLSGSPFDPSPPSVNIDALEEALAGLGGGFASQLQAAAQSVARLPFGALTDPLTASVSEIVNVISSALADQGFTPSQIAQIEPALLSAGPGLIDQIRSGQIQLDQFADEIGSGIISSFANVTSPPGVAFPAPLDPTQTLNNFNNQP